MLLNQIQYYYRLKSLGIDNFCEKDIKRHNQELRSFDDLSSQFELLKKSYEQKDNVRADIMVCVTPDDAERYIDGVVEVTVFHKVKKKMFSRKIEESSFSLSLTKSRSSGTGWKAYESSGIDLFFYDTTDFEEVKQIFYDYVTNQTIPNLSNWEHVSI